jgi:DNA-binding XRE family transcriptional regulator
MARGWSASQNRLTAIAALSAKAYIHYWSVSSDICVRFGKRLRNLRKRREWTQVYMAEHVGMDRSFISDLENGKNEICIRNLELLARAFEMSVSQLMSRL